MPEPVSATVSLQQLTDQLEQLEARAGQQIAAAASAAELEELRVGLLGKKGQLSAVLGAMGKLPGDERPLVGQRANVLKEQVQGLLSERLAAVKGAAMAERIAAETLDVTMPATFTPAGHRHPLISTIEEITDIFAGLGYRVEEGPEIESDHYNFTALNIPPHHPARDMQDTFYLSDHELLRTHTSPVQIRHLEKNPPPVRIVAPGRVYRRDAVDATHSPVFHQVEVLSIDEGLDFTHLRGTVTTFLQRFFGDLEHADALHAAGRAGEVLFDGGGVDANGFEQLRAAVAHVGGHAHLGHDLGQAFANRLDVVVDGLQLHQGRSEEHTSELQSP